MQIIRSIFPVKLATSAKSNQTVALVGYQPVHTTLSLRL